MEFKSFLFDYQQYQKEESNSYFDQNVLIGGIMGEHVNIGLKSRFSFGVDYNDTQHNELNDNDDNSNNSDNDDQYSGSTNTSDDEYSGSNDEDDEDDENDIKDNNNNNKYKQNNSGQLSLTNNWFVNTFFKKQQKQEENNIQQQEKEKQQKQQEEKEIRQLNKLHELEEIKLKRQLGESFTNILKQPTPNNIINGSGGGILEKMILQQQQQQQSPLDSLIRESNLDTIKKIQLQRKQDTYTITSPFSSSTSSSPLSTSTNNSPSSSCCTSDNDDEHQHNDHKHDINNQQDDIKCIDCLNTITQINDIIFLDCTHIYCRNCLNNFIRKRIEEKRVSKIKCKLCKTLLSEFDIKQVLDTKEEISKYDMASLDQVISKNKGSYIQCPCCNLFMEKVIVPLMKSTTIGKATLDNNNNKIEYDEQGKPLSRESIEHKRKFRFRCPQCSTIFCTECKVHPYHLGFTCAQFQIYNSSKHCRFCKIAIKYTTTPIMSPRSPKLINNNDNSNNLTTTTTTIITKLNYNNNNNNHNVCYNEECILKSIKSCDKTLSCGHECNGIINESKCLPCIHPDCEYFHSTTPGNDEQEYRTNQKFNDYCNICWTDSLSSEPCIQLECGHIFHKKCCSSVLKKKWTSSRISFGFIKCALCTQNMKHQSLEKYLTPINELYNQVLTKSLQRCDVYGVEKDVDFDDPYSKWYKNKQGYAMNRFSYYMCFKCKKPYFGGDQRMCGDGEGGKEFKPEELICGGCSSTSIEQGCKAHQKQFIEYKCFYCCSVAIFFCFGTTRFCGKCHEQNQTLSLRKIHPPCPVGPGGFPLESIDKCPLGLPNDHKTGVEMSLGCRICREDL